MEEGPLLKERERKRLKGALRQADRQWKATFDLLQLTQPGANGEFLDFERKDVSKQLGQALNMSAPGNQSCKPLKPTALN